jgi:hypothetical protein
MVHLLEDVVVLGAAWWVFKDIVEWWRKVKM